MKHRKKSKKIFKIGHSSSSVCVCVLSSELVKKLPLKKFRYCSVFFLCCILSFVCTHNIINDSRNSRDSARLCHAYTRTHVHKGCVLKWRQQQQSRKQKEREKKKRYKCDNITTVVCTPPLANIIYESIQLFFHMRLCAFLCTYKNRRTHKHRLRLPYMKRISYTYFSELPTIRAIYIRRTHSHNIVFGLCCANVNNKQCGAITVWGKTRGSKREQNVKYFMLYSMLIRLSKPVTTDSIKIHKQKKEKKSSSNSIIVIMIIDGKAR